MAFEKLKYVFNKNSGLKKISKISNIINGKTLTEEESELELNLSPKEISAFKYAPNCEVERSFSKYKQLKRISNTILLLTVMFLILNKYY
jgi:hypothetical protein